MNGNSEMDMHRDMQRTAGKTVHEALEAQKER
jgi:hypothetical protein